MQLSKCNRTKVVNEKARADNEKDKDGKNSEKDIESGRKKEWNWQREKKRGTDNRVIESMGERQGDRGKEREREGGKEREIEEEIESEKVGEIQNNWKGSSGQNNQSIKE